MKKIEDEFEWISTGLDNPATEWLKQLGPDFGLPHDFAQILHQSNGLKRVRDDIYFTFRLFPVTEIRTYESYMGIPADQVEEEFEFMGVPDPTRTVVIGGEGEYGLFVLDCAEGSLAFGRVSGIVCNIPECYIKWDSFTVFFEGIPAYCKKRPLAFYRENFQGSDPTYGW